MMNQTPMGVDELSPCGGLISGDPPRGGEFLVAGVPVEVGGGGGEDWRTRAPLRYFSYRPCHVLYCVHGKLQ